MTPRIPTTSLEEDLKALGLGSMTEDRMAQMALGTPLSMTEQGAPPAEEPEKDPDEEEEEDDDEEEEDDEEYDESVHDALDGPFVTPALFDRIEALPFDSLSEEQVTDLITKLKAKKIPGNIDGIRERAIAVADRLMGEAVAKRTRRARAHSVSKKASYLCPPGMRKDPSDPSGKRCIRAQQALGGAGKLAKIKRKAKKWARSGAGKKSSRISARWAERRPESQLSSFAVELEHVLSESTDQVLGVREEIVERIDTIIDLLVQEFDEDQAVVAVFNEAVDPLCASYEAGRLDEAVMAPDAFLAELRPVVALITRSLDRIDGVPGNR